jgi:hypothetical protein
VGWLKMVMRGAEKIGRYRSGRSSLTGPTISN